MLLYKIINHISEKADEPDNNYRSKCRIVSELKKLDEEYRLNIMLIDKKRNVSRSRSFGLVKKN